MQRCAYRFVSSRLRCALVLTSLAASSLAQILDTGWPTYGGDPGGKRFSESTQITTANLAHLHPAWTFHTHALDSPRIRSEEASFESTPVLFRRSLLFTSPFDVVFALDAASGREIWSFDPHASLQGGGLLVTSRGVAVWSAPPSEATVPCSARVFFGTLDARLLALDATTGIPCEDFGSHGQVDLKRGVHITHAEGYSVTSPPTVAGNLVVVGSSVADNQRADAESGLVRAFDVLTGRLLWSWEPLAWAGTKRPQTGAGNVWSVISADPVLGLIYLPTGSASPDFYGGQRPGDNRDADSVVALEASTGRRVWAFQVVHHDLWDYDVPSEPLLFTFRDTTPAIAITTKMGQIFVLDRRNGRPLYPIEERPVPQSNIPGERAAPTQPFSSLPSLSPLQLPVEETSLWQRNASDAAYCRSQLAALHYEGMYTPPGTVPTLQFPGNVGGVNWGGAAFDPSTGVLYASVNRQPASVTLRYRYGPAVLWHAAEPTVRDWPLWLYLAAALLIANVVFRFAQNGGSAPPARPWCPSLKMTVAAMLVALMAAIVCIFPRKIEPPHFGHEFSPQRGTPYWIERVPLNDHSGQPCVASPWGALSAINLNTGKFIWQAPVAGPSGSTLFGGPIVTASGLIFTAGSSDPHLRAFQAATGKELWSSTLPASARATPMTYTLDGRQFVVIAAGGHGGLSGLRGDSLVAFALQP